MLNSGQVYEIDSFLSIDEYRIVYDEFQIYQWHFRAGEMDSNSPVPIRTFWQKPLESSEYIVELFKNKIQNILNVKIDIGRVYGNGQAHGQSAWVHTDDSQNDGNIYGSLVYYLTPNWKPYYGGHLIFVDSVENPIEVLKSVFPKSNSAVMFNSTMPHMALEPSVYCLEQRESIAVKFKVNK
jgi:hypothetical protein